MPDDLKSQRYQAAVDAVADGRLRAAEGLLKANLLDGPRAAQSRYLLGVVELLLGRPGIARQLIDSAYSIKAWLKDLDPSVIDLVPHATAALEVDPGWTWARYEAERHGFFSVGLRLDHLVRKHLAGPDHYFVEVGANDGKSHDPIYPFVTRYGWGGLCIEPVPSTYEQLCATYAEHPKVATSQTAIAATEGTVEIHLAVKSTLATLTPSRNSLSKQSATTTVSVPSMPLESLLKREDVSTVDLLQIDTEGYDYEVLRTIDLLAWRPLVVNMEFYCLPLVERVATFTLLRDAGYAYRFDGMDLIAVRRDAVSPDFCVVDVTKGRWLG